MGCSCDVEAPESDASFFFYFENSPSLFSCSLTFPAFHLAVC